MHAVYDCISDSIPAKDFGCGQPYILGYINVYNTFLAGGVQNTRLCQTLVVHEISEKCVTFWYVLLSTTPRCKSVCYHERCHLHHELPSIS